MNFEVIVGLEIHVQMKTKSKMFSSAPVSFGSAPNTNVSAFDMAFPGTMPLVNKQAVINAIRVCHALHMSIDDELWFDRKNYFYSDLPKGYQITQHKRPIGKNGYLKIDGRVIHIERLHIEEDACKQVHTNEYTYIDYNRAGIPLIEIVSEPEIRSGEEAMKYVEKIRSIVSFLEVSDGKMEEGSLRCDINVSLKPIGSKKNGNKVEIKNVNTLTNIKNAINYEIKRQERILLSGEIVEQDTRRFDETSKQTVSMRAKTDPIDYKYFTEPNILPIKLSKEFIENAISTSPELAEAKYARYKSLGLSDYDSGLLVANKDISNYFDEVIKHGTNPKLAANWVLVDIKAVLNKKEIEIKDLKVEPKHLAQLLMNVEKQKISNTQARDLFSQMLESDSDPGRVLNNIDISLINDEQQLLKIIKEILDANPQSIVDYKNGKERAIGFLVGQVLKLSQGKANPELTNRLIKEEMKDR